MNHLVNSIQFLYSERALKAAKGNPPADSFAEVEAQQKVVHTFITTHLDSSLPLHHRTELGMECFVHNHTVILIHPQFYDKSASCTMQRGSRVDTHTTTSVVIQIFKKEQDSEDPLVVHPQKLLDRFLCTLQDERSESRLTVYPGTPLSMLRLPLRLNQATSLFRQLHRLFSQHENPQTLRALKPKYCIVSDEWELFFLIPPLAEPLWSPERAHAHSCGVPLPPSTSEWIWRLGALGAMILGGKDLKRHVEPFDLADRPRFLRKTLIMNHLSRLLKNETLPPVQKEHLLRCIASMLHPKPEERTQPEELKYIF